MICVTHDGLLVEPQQNISWHPSQRHNFLRQKIVVRPTVSPPYLHNRADLRSAIVGRTTFAEVSEKEDICTRTVLLCHVVCLEMIVLVYMRMSYVE